MSTPRAKTEVQAAEPVLLAGLVNYQAVSILGRDTGTITLFAFDEGQGLSEHTAPFDALVQMLEGEIEISIDGKLLTMIRSQTTV